MAEQSQNKSLSDLTRFLSYVESKGLMKPATIRSWKAACNKVLGILEENERNDISNVELENIFTRFENKNSQDFTPTSLQTYKNRVKKALSEFFAYRNNPSTWKPSLSQRSVRQSKNKYLAENQNNPEIEVVDQNGSDSAAKGKYQELLTHKFPLRDGIIINISGVPMDLKALEAKRIGAFLSTLCEDFKLGEF